MDTETFAGTASWVSAAHGLMRDVVVPSVEQTDRTGQLPPDVFAGFAEAGYLGLSVPEELGGSGAGVAALAAVTEVAAQYSSAAGLLLLLSRLPVAPLLLAGTTEQQRDYVTPQVSGERRGAFAMSESNAGSDPLGIETSARRSGSRWLISGTKCWVSGGAEADWLLVVARAEDSAPRSSRGVLAFVVDRESPGLELSAMHERPGCRGVSLVDFRLENVEVTDEARLPGVVGLGSLLTGLATMRPIVSARGLGLAEAALMLAVGRMHERQVGGAALSTRQGLQWRLADLCVELEAARLLTRRAAQLVDGGDHAAAGELAAAKLASSEIAVNAAAFAAQVHGAEGCLASHPADRLVRDARQLTVVEGTSEIQRTIIARAVLDGTLGWRDPSAVDGRELVLPPGRGTGR